MIRNLVTYRLMTDAERHIATALGRCSFPPATSHKRFAGQMARTAAQKEPAITDKQSAYLCLMAQRYRRQLPADIVALAANLQTARSRAAA